MAKSRTGGLEFAHGHVEGDVVRFNDADGRAVLVPLTTWKWLGMPEMVEVIGYEVKD